jgi:hypothetical protein
MATRDILTSRLEDLVPAASGKRNSLPIRELPPKNTSSLMAGIQAVAGGASTLVPLDHELSAEEVEGLLRRRAT